MMNAEQFARFFPKGLRIEVYSPFTEEEQLSISIACNDANDTFVTMNFYDRMYALKKGRNLIVGNSGYDVRTADNKIVYSKLAAIMCKDIQHWTQANAFESGTVCVGAA